MDTAGKASPFGVPSVALRPPGWWASCACVRTAGTRTHTSCPAWRLPGALLLNPLLPPHVLLGQGLGSLPGPGRGYTQSCPSSIPLSKVLTAHLISTTQSYYVPQAAPNLTLDSGKKAKRDHTRESRQVKGHRQEDRATPHLYGSRRHPSARVFRAKHECVEARGFSWLL